MRKVFLLRQPLTMLILVFLLLGPAIPARAAVAHTARTPLAPAAPPAAQDRAGVDQAAWYTEIVDLHGGRSPSLALDALGQPRIAYIGGWDPYGYGLKYARYENFTWYFEGVDDNGSDYVSLALDALGNPHISYYNSSDSDLMYAHYYDGNWHIQHVDTTGDVGQYSSIAVGSDGMPQISYWDSTNEAVKYARRVGASWDIQTVATVGGYGDATSLALDAMDYPHISYRDDTLDALRHAYYDGSSWHIETVDTAGYYTGEYSSIALDAQGHAHIAYAAEGLSYAYFDGSTWRITIVDDAFSAGDYPSLALDSAGRPHISYVTWNYPTEEVWLRHAYFDGFDWQFETVDARASAGGSYGGTSLAMDQADRPHIAYYDYGTDNLKYAVFREPCTPVAAASISGSTRLPIGVTGQYQGAYTPPGATTPVLYAWDNGDTGATASYSWTLAGDYTIAVTATNACGHAHATFSVQVFCQALTGAHITGPLVLLVDQIVTFRAVPEPITASLPLAYSWDNGTTAVTASYSWPATGTYPLAVTLTNACGSSQQASVQVNVLAEWPFHVFLPILLRQASH